MPNIDTIRTDNIDTKMVSENNNQENDNYYWFIFASIYGTPNEQIKDWWWYQIKVYDCQHYSEDRHESSSFTINNSISKLIILAYPI